MAKKNKKKVDEKKKGNEEEAKEEETDNVAEDEILTPVEVKELKIRMTRTLNRKAKLNQKLDTYGTEAPIVIGGYEFDDAYFADDSMGSDEDKKNDVSETEPESENVFESEKTPVEEICVSEKPTEVNIVVDADELDEYLKKYALERFFAIASEPPEVLRCDKMTSAQSLEPSWNTQEVQTDYTEMEGHVKNYIWGTWPSDASEAQKVQRLQSNKRISATQSLKELNTQEVQTDEKTGVEFNGSVEDDFEDVIVKKTLQDFSCNVSLDVVESREKRDVSTADFGANVLDDFREVIERRRNLERRRRFYSQRSGDYGDGYSDDDAYTTSEDSLKELSNKYNFKVLESRYKPILTCRRTNLRMFDDGDDYCEEFDDDLKRRECITKPDINKDVAYNETEEGSGVRHPNKKSKRMVSHQVPVEEVSKRKSKKPPYDEFATDPQDDSSCSLVTNVIETKITFGNIKEDSDDDDDDDDNFTQNPSIKSKQAGRVDLSVKNHIRGILTKPKLTPCKRIQFVDGRGAYRCVNIPSSCANNPEKSGDFTATSPVGFQQNPEDDVLLDNQDDYRYQKTPPINRKWENDVSTDAQEVGSFAPVQKLKRNPPQYVDSSPVAEGIYNAGSSPRSAGRTQIDVDDQCEDDQYEAEHIRSLAKALKEMWPAQGDAFNGVQKMDSATSPATEILRTTNRVDNNLRHTLLDNSYVVQSIDNYTSPSANADRKILLVDNDEAYENVGVYTMSPTNAPRRPTILNDSVHTQLVRNSRRTSSASNGGLHRNADLVLSCPEETYIVVDNPNQKPIKYIDISKEDYDELFEHENTPIKLVLQRDNEVDNELGMERDYLNDVSPVRGEPMVDQLLMDVPRKNCVAALPADVRRTLRDITNRSLKSKKTKADEFRDADDELTDAFLRNYCQCEPESNDSHSNSDCGCNSKNQKFRLVLEPADTGDHGSLNRKKRNEDQIRNRGITDDELRALKRAKRQELDDELCDRTEWECRRGDGSPVPQDTVVSRKHNHSSRKTSGMHEEIPLSHNDLRKFSAVESTEHVSVANVGAVRSVSLQEEEMFNESAHHRVGKRPEWNSEVELRSNASSSPVRERKSHGSRSDEERKHRSIKDKGDDRRSRTTPESRDNVYKEHSSHKYHDDVDRGSDWHSTNEDQRCRVSPSESHDRQHTRSRNERQLQRPNSDTYVQKRITTPAGQDERLAYRPVESYRGKCSRDGTPRSHSPVFYEDGPPKGKALSRPVSPEEGSYEDDEHVSKSPYGSSRGRSSGSGNTKSCKCQTDFDDPHQPQKQTSDCEVRPKPQNYIEESRRFLAEHRNIRAALEVKCNREFFRSKTIIPPWQTRGPANIGRCCGHREDRYRLADRHCFSSRKYAHNATRPMDYQQRVDCVGSSPNNFDAAGPSPVSSCFARTIIPTCPTTECLSCVQNNAQPLYVQPPGNRAYTNYEMPVRFYTDPVALSNMYGKQPVAMSSVYTNQPVAMPCNCVNQPEPLPLFNNCPKVEFQNQTCSPMQMAGFYKEDCHDGSSWNENYISQGYVPAPAYSQERRVPRAWFKKAKDDDSDST
ncbi:uncharacterized protein LOC131958438 isoform X1 [Physella acuta]|uniref:uncharacterized protein LOC131958438 isoform X1 n=1 Tax=Physella acuta TaxID=109671 RepID=UPI0027DDD6AA|nr:uncharacterized protein LOC131958438 isoform X1 [Physella acuta]XP_059179461.1 uncharacterized protein LOC131958438 isoform X1 [Physella acuta]